VTKSVSFLALGVILLTSCRAVPGRLESAEAKFGEEKSADIVVRYYTDQVCRVVKPLKTEGPFLTTYDRGGACAVANEQIGRGLAVVILVRFNAGQEVKQWWLTKLGDLGYKRVVFLRAMEGMQINGLPIMKGPSVSNEGMNTGGTVNGL
jgi:hypothetical protein